MGPVAMAIGQGIENKVPLNIGDGVAHEDSPQGFDGLIRRGRGLP